MLDEDVELDVPGTRADAGSRTAALILSMYPLNIDKEAREYALVRCNISYTSGSDGGNHRRNRRLQNHAGAADPAGFMMRARDSVRGRTRMCGTYDLNALQGCSERLSCRKMCCSSGTVRDNLKWGDPEATDEEIWEACRAACADEFLNRMPEGLDTDAGVRAQAIFPADRSRDCVSRRALLATCEDPDL